MELLQQSKAIFYHPCNDETEYLKTQDWTETTPTYAAGKVSDALFPTAGDPAFGAEAEFMSAGNADCNSAAALSASSFVVAYRDVADSNHGTARVGTVSGTDIAFGTEAEFLSADGVAYISVAAIDATKFVVAYSDFPDSGHGTAKIGIVAGTAITFYAEAEFLSAGTAYYNSVAVLDVTGASAKFVVAYTDGADSWHGTAKIGTVDGTAITFYAEAEFRAGGAADYISAAALGASKFVVAYRDNDDSNHGTAKVGTVGGTDITFGPEAEFNSAGTASFISAAALGATKFVVAYQDVADSFHGTARVGTVGGTDITFGAEAEFLSADGVYYVSAAALDSSKFVVAYMDNADSSHGTAKVGTVSGTDVAFGAEAEFQGAGRADHISAAALSATDFVVAYSDDVDASHGTAKVGTLPAPAASLAASTPAAYDSADAAAKVAFCGWFRKPSAS